ncbi:LRRT4 protein, partial [Atractosteus spatula]|nr:LRRT4 protein [Atractosteus spatula]
MRLIPLTFALFLSLHLCLCHLLSLSLSVLQIPHQVSALTFYRYEQPIVDYCQAHQPLHLNVGFEGAPQSLEELGGREHGTIQTLTIPSRAATSLTEPRTSPQ